jgi:broad specificity phosphatase PhoE
VDEALKVMDRLARIEALERDGCPADVLLGEVRALLHEAEAWVRAEPGGTERAAEALDRSRAALAAVTRRQEVTA